MFNHKNIPKGYLKKMEKCCQTWSLKQYNYTHGMNENKIELDHSFNINIWTVSKKLSVILFPLHNHDV